MHVAAALSLGLLAGATAASLAAWVVARRHARLQIARFRNAEQRARAAERMAEIGAMTGGLAHEIKNPLSTIGLNVQLLAEGLGDLRGVDTAERDRLLRRADALHREVERLRHVLGEFLDYAGVLRLERRPVDLTSLVVELGDFFMPQASSTGVRLLIDPGPTPLLADIDANHIKQAVLNLLLNAVQAMARTPEDRPRELILRASAQADEAAVHVVDTGPGIDPPTLQRMFTPYFTTRAGGSGLGLPIARRIAEAHGGRIEVHTELGQGTDIALVLPRSERPSVARSDG